MSLSILILDGIINMALTNRGFDGVAIEANDYHGDLPQCGYYRAAGKIFACRAFEWRGIYPSLRRARDSLLIDISNHCARIAVLHAKEARFAVNKRNVKNKTDRNLVTYCCVAKICQSDSDSATIFTASVRIHWTSRYKEAMVHVPGISSEFKSPYNKPFIVADDEKKKRFFSSLESVRRIVRNNASIVVSSQGRRRISRSEKLGELARRENTGMAEWRTIPIRCDVVWVRICVTRRLFTVTFTNAFVLWSQWRSTMIKRPFVSIERRFVEQYCRNWFAANYFDGRNEVVINAFYAVAIHVRLGTWLLW